MVVFLNGKFVAEEQARVSIFDRAFLYGDGLFETMRITGGKPYLWNDHWARLRAGANFLKIDLPYEASELEKSAVTLAQRNSVQEAVLRLTVSRGVGKRGYSPRGADEPVVVMTIHASPDLAGDHLKSWSLMSSAGQLRSGDPLAAFKTCNRLPQVLARAEADRAGADEAVLGSAEGWLLEGAASNLFWIQSGRVHTPPLGSGILPGITRAVLLQLCNQLGIETCETNLTGAQLLEMDGAFLSLSSLGMAEAVSLDGKALRRSAVTQRLHAAYVERLRRGHC